MRVDRGIFQVGGDRVIWVYYMGNYEVDVDE